MGYKKINKTGLGIFKKIYNSYWNLRFLIVHPKLKIEQSDVKKLKIVLGIGRSGTTWISNILATTRTPVRYFEEPLHHIRPILNFSRKNDRTALNYYDEISNTHRLYIAYKLLTVPKYNWDKIGLKSFLKRDTDDFQYCLVKEVHCLLATEALLSSLNVKAIIVIRNPIYIIDSIFNAQGISSLYLINETEMIRKNIYFLKKNFPKNFIKIQSMFNKIKSIKNARERKILETALTVAVLTSFLYNISKKNISNIYLIKYENLCMNPKKYFSEMSDFLSLSWDDTGCNLLTESTAYKNGSDKDPYSIFRNTSSQTDHPLKFLTKNEVYKINQMLIKCILNDYTLNINRLNKNKFSKNKKKPLINFLIFGIFILHTFSYLI